MLALYCFLPLRDTKQKLKHSKFHSKRFNKKSVAKSDDDLV